MKIISGRRKAPMSVFLYGPQGAGKSTAAADFDDPLFLSGQEGSSELDVKRWCFDDKTERTFPLTWDEVLSALAQLKSEKGFKTLVIDELQAIELLCVAHVCATEKVTNIGKIGGGFGKGEAATMAEMRKILKSCEEIHACGKHVVLCSHAKQGKVPRPETGDSYQRYEPSLTSANNADSVGMFVGWCSAVLFIRPEVDLATKGEGVTKKTIGISTGRRVMHTEGEAAWIAKCRYRGVDPVLSLPPHKPMAEFFRQVAEGQDVKAMQAKVKSLADEVGGDWPAKVATWLSTPAANDLVALHERATWFKAQQAA